MAKEDLIEYITTVLEEANLEFDWLIQWNKRQHGIEIYFTLFVETDSSEVIEDVEGTVSENDIIEFEDGIVFYDPTKSKIELEDYLIGIPFDSKKGIEKGLIEAVAKYLRIVVTEGHADLMDFATDPTIESFEMNWDQQAFLGTIETLKETGRYDATLVSYPKY
ncbi:DUF3013 family protein [Carnobacterium gallinarum]|uniref:DUF3013 family protein n=1 Tax=Carnobacterium gallinarum TaxID=2749 RepID=UPI0005524015|nr:DUF3013 family protein [Carnobacterium gallinarum]